MLETTALRFAYPGGFALDTEPLAIAPGAITVLVGPNGCGKSTFLHLLAGVSKPAAGRVTWEGRTRAELGARQWAQRIALVAQSAQAVPPLPVGQYVALGTVPSGGLLGARPGPTAAPVRRALADCELLGQEDALLAELSGGQRQRARIARALAQEPRVLVLDEPTNHLDVAAIGDLVALLYGLARSGMAIVLSTHDIDLAVQLADRVVVMAEGRMHETGVPDVLTPELVRRRWGADMVTVTVGGRTRYLVDYA